MKNLIMFGRLLFGAWMLGNGISHFFYPLWSFPAGHTPLAVQLMAALQHSGLLGVAMAIELVAGALILLGVLVPVALCVVMPVSTCALYWSLILDHQSLDAALGAVAFALNGLLMLAYLDYYKTALQRHALTFGESSPARGSFAALYVNPTGRTSRGDFIAALIALLAVVAFYAFVVRGLTAHWCLLVLVYPGTILLARRLHDMGRSAWPVLIPAVLTVAAFAGWLHVIQYSGPLGTNLSWAALVVSVGFALWGCLGSSQAQADRVGTALAT